MIYDTRLEGSEWVERWIIERRDYNRLREIFPENAVKYLEDLYPVGTSIRQKDGMAVCPSDRDLNRITTAIVHNLQNEKYPALKDAFMKLKDERLQLGKEKHCIVRTAMDIKTNEINYYSENIPGPNHLQPVQDTVQPTPQPVQQAPVPQPVPQPVQETEVDFPATMAQLMKMVSELGDANSKYDFGQFVINKPSQLPSLERALKTYRVHHLNAIARALILRKFGKKFKTEDVYRSARKFFGRYSNTKQYHDVIKDNLGSEACKTAKEQTDAAYSMFLDGVIGLKGKKFSDAFGQPWDIHHFIIYMVENLKLKIPKYRKR